MDIEVVVGDITTMRTDVVVTAANRSLVGGGGVDAAIHRAAGPELLRALRPLAPCPIGGAVITPAFDLDPPVRHIVHAVGPRYGVDDPAEELLVSAYRASLARCDEVSASSVAFPSLSTGAYHYPLLEACQISTATLTQTLTRVERCVLVAFDVKTERFWRRALANGASRYAHLTRTIAMKDGRCDVAVGGYRTAALCASGQLCPTALTPSPGSS